MAHASSRGVGHLPILQVIAGVREQIVVAAMVIVHVADDDVPDTLGGDSKREQAVAHRLDDLALAAPAHRLVEAGIDDDRARRPDNGPHEEVERLQHVVRIAADEILRRPARVMAVTYGVNLVDVIAHEFVLGTRSPPSTLPASIIIVKTRESSGVQSLAHARLQND